MKRMLLFYAIAVFYAVALFGQLQSAEVFNAFDLDDTTYIFCDTTDIPGIMSACSTGAAAGDGWITVSRFEKHTVGFIMDQVNVTGGIDVQIQGRMLLEDGTYAAAVSTLFQFTNKTAVDGTDDQLVTVVDGIAQIRVGIKIGTADDGDDTGANAEQITVLWNGY